MSVLEVRRGALRGRGRVRCVEFGGEERRVAMGQETLVCVSAWPPVVEGFLEREISDGVVVDGAAEERPGSC